MCAHLSCRLKAWWARRWHFSGDRYKTAYIYPNACYREMAK